MPTRINRQHQRTALDLPAIPRSHDAPAPIPPLPFGYDLIDDGQTSGLRTWSSAKIVDALGGAGGAGGVLYLATAVGGTGDAITVEVPGLVLSATPVLIALDPLLANTGPGTIKVNDHDPVPLVGRQNNVLIAGEIIPPITHIVRVTSTGAKIVSGSI